MCKKILSAVLFFFLSVFFMTDYAIGKEPLLIFCGAAFKRPMEDIVKLYQQETDTKVDVNYGGVGTLFSQILLSKRGDVFVVPSPDIMGRAKTKGVVIPDSIKDIAFVAPCINVQKGNPKNIQTLKDLTKPGIKVGLANPEIVYIGAIAVEIMEKNLSTAEKKAIKENVVTYVEDFNKLATLIVLKQVDAIIGFHFLEGWYPDKVGTIKLKTSEISRIGAGQTAVVSYTGNRTEADKFILFLLSEDVKTIFRKYQYFGSTDEAFRWVGARKIIGGEFTAIEGWVKK
ncbi:MAG: extracellular solute-binding protein [Syntrophorhabdaceae bacterium]|nr:extracellular solute-binding protein [Syntrophorhabdaceae bacterium]